MLHCPRMAYELPLGHTKTSCSPSSLLQPLSPSADAFNPCFLLYSATLFLVVATPAAGLHLVKLHRRPRFGDYSPKSTSFLHFLQCLIVGTIGLLQLYLTTRALHGDNFKLLVWVVSTGLVLLGILPIHVIERNCLPIQSPVLLSFWPLWSIVQLAFVYHDLVSRSQVFFNIQDAKVEAVVLILSICVFVLEVSGSSWRPSHQLLAYYMKNPILMKHLKQPNLIQRLTFTYMNPLIASSYKTGTVSPSEIPEIPFRISSKSYTSQYEQYCNTPGPKTKGKLTMALIKSFWHLGLISFGFELSDRLLNLLQPQLLRFLILFIQVRGKSSQEPILKGFLISFAMFVITLLQTSINNQYMLRIVEFGFACRASLSSLVFQKSLKLSNQARSERATGDVVNLVSIDASRVQSCAQEISTLVIAPTEFVICMWSLYSLLGKASFAAVLVILVSTPLNSVIFKIRKKISKRQMKIRDERTTLTGEILNCMKSIKLYAWEKPMLDSLLDLRNNVEIKNLLRGRIWSKLGDFIWILTPFIVCFATFSTFALISEVPLTSDIVFPALSLLGLLSKPILQFPSLFNYIIEGSVALERISSYLNCSEIDTNLLEQHPTEEEESLAMENLSFLWSRLQEQSSDNLVDKCKTVCAIQNIQIQVGKGEFACVVGKIGSGKSALLYSMLGQLEAINSIDSQKSPKPIRVHGSVAYCSQTPWIMNATVKENILFGHEYDEEYYKKTVEACQLLPDLKILPDNDMTQVGENGISLSGGQKARLSLARAVYCRADIYLLDDVLSAVDGHVGKAILENVFSGSGLLAAKTVILATNNIKVLPFASKIYFFEHGQITEETEYSNINAENTPKLLELVTEFGGERDSIKNGSASSRSNGKPADPPAKLAPFDYDPFKLNSKSKRTGNRSEVSAKGKVKWSVYWGYIQAASATGMFFWFCSRALATVVSVRTVYWLKEWAEHNTETGNNSSALHYVSLYGLLGFITCVISTISALLLWCVYGLRGGMVIHDNMARCIMKAPMLFFERTPVGRIMNRFSNDVNKVDASIPRSFEAFTACALSTIITLVIVIYAIPQSAIILLAMAFAYQYYQKYYVAVQREMKRLVSVSRSPIYAHLQESLNGAQTIGAYKQQNRFRANHDANIDFNLKSLYMLRSVNRWLSVRLQLMGSLIIWTASSLLIYKASTSSKVTAGLVGFVMSYTLLVTSNLRLIIRYAAEVESNIVSVERCMEYATLKKEENDEDDFEDPPSLWPSQGRITFKDYSTKYAENLDYVLKNVSFEVRPGEKVGVVGRTGAGKSSLIAAIFRIIPAYSGNITIDGISNAYMRLFDLRHNLSIIPQDSHMFEGTVRKNLDPIGSYSDERLWHVLELSGLKETIQKIQDGKGLDSLVNEGGLNFSGGQRQLICLGRALLNPSKILVLDEATAAVDVQTDKIIQKTIRDEFRSKTIITIAHRLDTVMDSDRILTLDHGEVKEFDTPDNLLKDKNSLFASMCEAHK